MLKKYVLVLSLSFLCGSAFADADCNQKIEQRKEDLARVQEEAEAGKATLLDVADAKLAIAEQIRTCKLISKPNYCKYTQDLLNYKINILESEGSDASAVKEVLQNRITYCIDASLGI